MTVRIASTLAVLVLVAPLSQAQTKSWVHVQVSGAIEQTCTITLTIGSEVIELPSVPLGTTASQICRDLAREINSARHGHLLHAACNGVDGSILSIIADGSPTPSTTPWLGRLVPRPSWTIEPSGSGIKFGHTNIQDTLVAIDVEGERANVFEGEITIKLNGREFTLPLEARDPETSRFTDERVTSELSEMINDDPGFRSSVLRDDTGQLKLFITSENMGGGVRLEEGPTSVEGLRFSRSRVQFASQTLHAASRR